mmetsp:Transcript_37593/g.111553  ORF Transcript_37593/g.111553 Transcript_37593/m.111553 type:complete len:318 (+) Transcript_37593:381-1334(+)
MLMHRLLDSVLVGHLRAQPQHELLSALQYPAEARVERGRALLQLSRNEQEEGLLLVVRRDPEERQLVRGGRRLPAGADAEPLPEHQQLAGEAGVRVADRPDLPQSLVRRLEGDLLRPHHVGYRDGGRPAHALAAVHQHAAACCHLLLDPLDRPVEDRRQVLPVGVLHVIRAVLEVIGEAVVADVGGHVHNVRDPMTLQDLQGAGHLVAGDKQGTRHRLRAVLPKAPKLEPLENMVREVVVVLLVVRVVRVDELLLGHVYLLEVEHGRRRVVREGVGRTLGGPVGAAVGAAAIRGGAVGGVRAVRRRRLLRLPQRLRL